MATSRPPPSGEPSPPPGPSGGRGEEDGRAARKGPPASAGTAPPPGEQATVVVGVSQGTAGRLVVEAGAHKGEEVLLGAGSCVIGRSSSCALVLRRSAGISRRHAKVHFSEDAYFLEDLESRNGTKRNGELIESRVRLHDGDVIGISGDLIRFIHPAPPGDPAVSPAADAWVAPVSAGTAPASRTAPRGADEDTAPVVDATPYVHGTRPPRRMGSGAWVGGVLFGGILTGCITLLVDLIALDGGLVDSLFGAGEAMQAQPTPPSRTGARTEEPSQPPPPTPPTREPPPPTATPAHSEDEGDLGTAGDRTQTNEPSEPAGAQRTPGASSRVVRAVVTGSIERLHVRVGDTVRAGELLVSLSRANPSLSRKRQALLREEASFAPLAAAGNPRAQQDLDAVRRELRALETDLKATPIRAEAPGRVVTVYVQRGMRVQRGEELLVIDAAGAAGPR